MRGKGFSGVNKEGMGICKIDRKLISQSRGVKAETGPSTTRGTTMSQPLVLKFLLPMKTTVSLMGTLTLSNNKTIRKLTPGISLKVNRT